MRLLLTTMCLALTGGLAVAQGAAQALDERTTVIWVVLPDGIELKKTLPGTALAGTLARAVYWRDTEVFPRGSHLRMVVDQVEARKQTGVPDDRPFFIHLFAPRHTWVARFRSVEVSLPGGEAVALRATFIGLNQRAMLKAPPNTIASSSAGGDSAGAATPSAGQKSSSPWVLTLRVEPEGTTLAALAEVRAARGTNPAEPCPQACNLAEGARLPVVLLSGLSASKNRNGQTFQALLLEPVWSDSRVALPQGTIVQGVLSRSIPPRRLYRPASLNLVFTRLVLPGGAALPIAASAVGGEVDKGTHMAMDAEGRIRAQSPGKARLLLDFGVTGGISKVADDTTQLIIEAISSTATDASTAGVARFAAMGASAIFLLTRHGRDVILPAYTEIDVALSRAVDLHER